MSGKYFDVLEAMSHRIIAIGVDPSEYSEKAFDWFITNIYHEGDRLILIHSHELHPPVMPHMILTDEWTTKIAEHENIIKNLEERYEEKCKALNLSAKIIVQSGPPGEKICEVAKKEAATFIVIGSRGTGTIRRTILGSVSDYVIHHAHMPVVVIPKQD